MKSIDDLSFASTLIAFEISGHQTSWCRVVLHDSRAEGGIRHKVRAGEAPLSERTAGL